jgi:DNA polymerase-3 subunit gamma/tau
VPRRPLARIYRPQRFAEVLGQEAPVRALSAAAARGDVASAYIFSGTRGIGKTTIARVFAKALNCDKGPAADCCDACTPCREIAEARALDVLELDAATHTGIDDVRELREAAQYPPTRDRYRIFILDEAHQLSTAAWNGLLKILEEPPPYCVFLFCTTEPHKIPATIESRALHFAFRSPSPAAIRGHLAEVAKKEKVAVEDEALDLLSRAADGSVRDGLSALDQVRALAEGRDDRTITAAAVRDALGLIPGEVVTRYLAALAGGDAASALAVVAELDREGQDLRSFAGELLDRVRHAAVARATGRDAEAAELGGLAIEQLAWLGKVLDETEMRLRQNAPQRVLMDLATVRMTRMASLPALASVVEALGRGGPAGAPRGTTPGGPAGGARPAPSRPAPAAGGPPPARPTRSAEAVRPAAPAAEPAAPAAELAASAGGLLGPLGDELATVSPALANYLGALGDARLDARGTLVLELRPEKRIWKDRFAQPAAREALLEAARRVLGSVPAGVEVLVAGNGAAAPAGAPAAGTTRSTRAQALDAARRDPVVKEIFERFGAVLLDGQPLDDGGGPAA